jgi:carbon-monoxide dehydrogenase iron sulfur subunit
LKQIFCRIERCLGCKSCELSCAVEHSLSKNIVDAVAEEPRPANRVRVLSLGLEGSHVSFRSMMLLCRQCAEPACAEACICGGIVKDEESGIVTFNTDRCVGCWSCTMVCPFGAIVRIKDFCNTVKCDLCPERDVPACVSACPTGALVYCEPEEFLELTN